MKYKNTLLAITALSLLFAHNAQSSLSSIDGGGGSGATGPTGASGPTGLNGATGAAGSSTYAVSGSPGLTGASVGKLVGNVSNAAALYQLAPAQSAQYTVADNTPSTTSSTATVNVVWSHLGNMTAAGPILTGTGSNIAYDEFAYSDQSTTGDATVKVKPFTTSGLDFFIGLTQVADTTPPTYDTVNYALEMFNGTEVQIIESGVSVFDTLTPYTTADEFSITRTGGTITYAKNGSVFFTSAVNASGQNLFPELDSFNTGQQNTEALLTSTSIATAFTLTDPLGGGPFTITAGVNWTPGGTTASDAAAIVGAMNSVFTGWTAVAPSSLITLTRNVSGADPGTTLTFNGSPNSGAMTVSTVTTGSNVAATVPYLGILSSISGGNANIDAGGVGCTLTSEAITLGEILSGANNGQVKGQIVANGDLRLGIALIGAVTGATGCWRY